MGRKNTDEVDIAVLYTEISSIKTIVNDIKTKLETQYVTKDQFSPVRNIVYGLVSLILVSFVGTVTAFFYKK